MADPPGDPLLPGLAAGREEAFASLYAREGGALFRVAFALLGARADAEDAVQEVFVGLARARPLASVQNLRAYLFTSLRHTAARIAARRRADRREPLPDALAAPQPCRITAAEAARLERALAALPADRREVVALKIDAGLTFREIASVLGISPNTAASRYRYALAELRDILGGNADE
jgi:RNA polymerase sigma-70 factor (ECF subfamily)